MRTNVSQTFDGIPNPIMNMERKIAHRVHRVDKLKAAELRSASEYIRFLIQKEQLKDLRDEIDKLLLEAQTSGPGTPMTLQEWKDIEQEGLALLAQERKDARKGHQKRRW